MKREIIHPKGFVWSKDSKQRPKGTFTRITDPQVIEKLKSFSAHLNVISKLRKP